MNDTTPLPPGVRLSNASLMFDGETLFDRLSFDLKGGEWTCLLGASGVGKSTLARVIAGLASDVGEVAVSDERPLEGRVAMMAQNDLLLPWMTVLENVVLGQKLRRERPDTTRARQLLADVGLEDVEGTYPAALSGGMRQRVALVRTLVEDRPVVLMDEPFGALDAVTRFKLQNLAARLLAGKTVFMVTHDPMEALRLGHKLYVMTGRPATFGKPITPIGLPPRSTHDSDLLDLQADLLDQLAAGSSA